MLEKQVPLELKATVELLGPQEPKETKERGAQEDLQVKLGSLEPQAPLDQRGLKDLEVNRAPWDFLVPEDHPAFLETLDFQVFLGSKDHQVLLDFLVNQELQENQERRVKSLLQVALKLWPFLVLLVLLDPQALLESLVCLVPLVQLECPELLAPKETQEPTESQGRRERKEKRVIKEEKEIKEMGESLVSAPVLSLSVPHSPAVWALLLDLQVHLVLLDLQDHPERPDHRVLQVKVNLVLQDAKVPQVLQGLQDLAHLDLEATKENLVTKEKMVRKEKLATRENLEALSLHQKPSLRDHQDLPDLQVQRVQQVNLEHQGLKVNQANQDFLEVRENQAMVSLDSLVLRDLWDPLDPQVQHPHQAPLAHLDLPVRMVLTLLT